MAKALLLIDLQNDFLPGGSLAVADSDKIIPLANSLMPLFKHVIATKDYHPHNHKSFASQHANKKVGDLIKLADLDQILWPDHCVQNEVGSELSPKLNTKMINKIFYKGTNPYVDSYSAFFD
ncbi:MAG: isochorismatase family protein, partial [bacterium]|nr:isochorismatase family protein [bacterium]